MVSIRLCFLPEFFSPISGLEGEEGQSLLD
jgi:hypothetical protein